MTEINDQLLLLNHQIRQTEHSLTIARKRKTWSNVSLFLGPVFILLLYILLWIPNLSDSIVVAIYIPAVPVALSFALSAFYLKRTPGGQPTQRHGSPGSWLSRAIHGDPRRPSEGDLELELARLRDTRKLVVAREDVPAKVRRVTYKEDAYSDVDQLRSESRGYRRVNNALQGIIIIGSLAATGVSGVAAEWAELRWATLGITFLVGISSGFMGYFKYKERSFYLQQTADAIESEWEAVEIGVGRYKHIDNEEGRLAEFVEEVHRLKSEQKKRQQNLEQPPESRNSAE
ncbi:SLATT domain-containing protein [Marinitenerispora sediminis]|uniref:SLATT domain-containing protein n=1 Tax=Marinitenerispora sediminis TaxID=1931232 RepID=UPI0018F21E9E|nr:SLATT domain-containing protein [Marinitenerispora sediminis]